MKEKYSRLAGLVIWHEPTIDNIENTRRLALFFKKLYVIDNSNKPINVQENLPIESVIYTWMGCNLGIAAALNYGCKLLIEDGFEYALTLDQDSIIEKSSIDTHAREALTKLLDPRFAIVGMRTTKAEFLSDPDFIEVASVITSGNILRLSAWSAINGFNEKLFIDQVDHEFCYRLRKHGYQVLMNTSVELNHQVGNPISKEIFGFHITTTNHHWVRRYYQIRNSLYLRQNFPEESKSLTLFLRDIRDMCLGILILEDHRYLKLKAMLLGAIDYYFDKFGRWEDNHPAQRW
jgi:rhamnosyltransferase